MKTIKLILKGILLYTTMILAMLYICGVDSIYDNGYFLPATGIVALLIYIYATRLSQKRKPTYSQEINSSEDYLTMNCEFVFLR